MNPKLIVIGLDGATFEIMDPLLEKGQLPYLAQLMSQGVRARLLSTIPYATIPAWPSFMTGSNPGRHGVFDFFTIKDGKRRLSHSGDLLAPTMWEVLSTEGKRSVVLNVPATYPPAPINGVLVSGMLTPTDSPFASPPDVMSFLHARTNGYRVNVHSHLAGQRLVDDIYEVTEKQKRGFMALLRRGGWDFAMIMFRATDVVQHHFWARQDVVHECYSVVDSCIGDILKAFPNATLFLISDHGLQGQYRDFHINKWLIDEGYMSIVKGRATDLARWQQIGALEGRQGLARRQMSPSSTYRVLLKLGVTGHNLRKAVPRRWWNALKRSVPEGVRQHIPATEDLIYDVDWQGTQASAYQLYATESKAIKIINTEQRTREEISVELVDKLQRLRDPRTGERLVRRAYRREDLYSGPYVDLAPDIVLDLHDGYNITNAFFAEDYVTPRDQVRGCHHREGIFVASGQDIERGQKLPSPPYLTDVMPTALHYLGASVPAHCDGRVLTEIFDPQSEPTRRPIRRQTMDTAPLPVPREGVLGREEEAEIQERLRALGYL